MLLEDLLTDKYEVVTVESYPMAAAAILGNQEKPFHVAVIDMRLDDKDSTNEQGLDLANQLKKISRYTNTIIVTGYAKVPTVIKAFQELDVFGFVEKYPEGGESFKEKFRAIVGQAAENAHRRRDELKCDRGKLCNAIDSNSTDREIRIFQQSLRRIYDCPEFRNFDALRGPAKWDKIDHLLEIWETTNTLCRACEIYRTEIRPNNDRLEQELRGICSYGLRPA